MPKPSSFVPFNDHLRLVTLGTGLLGLGLAFGCGSSGATSGSGGSGTFTTTGTTPVGTGGSGGTLFQFGGGGNTSSSSSSGTSSSSGSTGTGGTGGAPPVCDPNPTTGPAAWAKNLGDGANQYGVAVAVDQQGNVFVTGSFSGTLQLAAGLSMTAVGNGSNFFVAKFSPTGQALWGHSTGDAALGPNSEVKNQFGKAIAVDKSGNVLIGGSFTGTMNLPGKSLVSFGSFFADAFVAKLDTSGNTVWAKALGDVPAGAGSGSVQDVLTIASDSLGNVAVGGYLEASLDLGGKQITGQNTSFASAFVALLDATGAPQWASSYGNNAGDQHVTSLAFDKNNDLFVTGYTEGSITFPPQSALSFLGMRGSYLAKLKGATGASLWSKAGIDAAGATSQGVGVAADPVTGGVAIAGYHKGDLDWGGGPLGNMFGDNVYVARLDAGGTHVWSHTYGDSRGQQAHGVAIDSAGRTVVVGEFTGELDAGPIKLVSSGNLAADAFAIKLDTLGCPVWAKAFGDGVAQGANAVAIDATKNVLITGHMQGTVDFGAGALTSGGADDLFLAKFGP